MPVKTRRQAKSQSTPASTTRVGARAEPRKRGSAAFQTTTRTLDTKKAVGQKSPPAPTTPQRKPTSCLPLTPASLKSTNSSSSRTALDPEVQKELCEDIESAGGIAIFVGSDHRLSKLLNKLVDNDPLKKELYGSSGTDSTSANHRKRIRAKVFHWQSLFKEGKYEQKVLGRFAVVAHKYREQSTLVQETSSLVQSFADFSIRDSASVLETSQSNKSSSSSTDSSLHGSFFPPSEVPVTHPPEQITVTIMSGSGIENPTPIVVDTEVPWKNGPFIIVPVKDMVGIDGTSFYNGFCIMLKINPRWMTESKHEGDYFEARLLEDKKGRNHVLVKVPVGDFVMLNETEAFSNAIPDYLSNALFNMQNIYEEQREENDGRDIFEYFVLKFPHEYELSASVINDDAGKGEELKFNLEQVPNVCDHDSSFAFQNKDTWYFWQVARVDVKAEKKAKREKKQSKGLAAINKRGKMKFG